MKREIDFEGVKYVYSDGVGEPPAVGWASNAPSTAHGVIRRVRQLGITGIKLLDICCGLGVIGLTIYKTLGENLVESLVLSDINVFNVDAVRQTLRENAMAADPRVRCYLSDGLKFLPKTEQFSLIVSNPPHCVWDPKAFNDNGGLTSSILGTYDREWAFHREFFATCHDHLLPNGEVWFLENGFVEGGEKVITQFIAANKNLKLIDRYEEPEDPGYYWLIVRKVS